MWELVVYVAFGDPKWHITRQAHERVARFESVEACNAAKWDWFARGALPHGYAPWVPGRDGWMINGPPTCVRVAAPPAPVA